MGNRRDDIQSEITALKMLLGETDYRCLKYAEGALTEEEYSQTKAQRAAWRGKINELEAALDADDGESETGQA